MLSIAASMLGAEHVVGFEIDADAIEVAQSNLIQFELTDMIDIVQLNLNDGIPRRNLLGKEQFWDTVIMNPPFGTKQAGIDMTFLQQAVQVSNVVYSLHKSSTRGHIEKKAADWGCQFEVLAEMRVRYFSVNQFRMLILLLLMYLTIIFTYLV
jgi:predicted RNA methylase